MQGLMGKSEEKTHPLRTEDAKRHQQSFLDSKLVGDWDGGGDVEVERDAGFGGGVGLRGTDPEVDGTGGEGARTVGCDDREFARGKGEGDGLRGVGIEMNALEAGERADRRAFDVGMGEVKLDNLVAGNRRGVRNAA